MNRFSYTSYRSLLFLAMGCALSGTLVAYEWQALQHHPLSLTPSSKAQLLAFQRTNSDSLHLMPLEAYQEMVKMPLFFAGRAETIAVTTSADDGSLKLTGIVNTPQGFVALMQDKEGAHYKLNQGEDVKGWKVSSVQKDRIELVRDTESLALSLFEVHKKRDLTAQDLEQCFKNQVNLPLEECFKHPDKYAHKAPSVSA